MHQGRRNRRVDATGDSREHTLPAYLTLDARHRFFDNGGWRPARFDSANLGGKIFKQPVPFGRVMDFRMELDAEIFSLQVAHGRKGTVATARQGDKAFRQAHDLVTMRHPYF